MGQLKIRFSEQIDTPGCWRRTRAWLVGKSHPETINNCENYSGQFDDVEQAAVGDIEDIEQKKT